MTIIIKLSETPTAAEALARAIPVLAAAGVEEPRRDARLLLAHAADVAPHDVMTRPERVLAPAEAAAFAAAIGRRAAREPVSRIVGRRGFWTFELALGPEVLDPRPDSETLVEAVLEALARRRGEPLSLLDLGTGSGCLLLALLAELPAAQGVGVDRAAGAVAVARDNAVAAGLAGRASFQVGNWDDGMDNRFDVVLSNPPYIPDGDIDALAPEVRLHDPRAALAGGPDGLSAYRELAPRLVRRLNSDGLAAIEVGHGQAGSARRIMEHVGLVMAGVRTDLSGVERCLIFRSAAQNDGT